MNAYQYSSIPSVSARVQVLPRCKVQSAEILAGPSLSIVTIEGRSLMQSYRCTSRLVCLGLFGQFSEISWSETANYQELTVSFPGVFECLPELF